MKKEPYATISYYAPKFFLNVDTNGNPGFSILMMTKKCDSNDNAFKKIIEPNFIITERNDDIEKLSIKIFKEDFLDTRISTDDIIKGKFYFKACALREDIWSLPEEKQREIVKFAKDNLISALVSTNSQPTVNLTEIIVVLSNYSKEKEGKAYFTQLSNEGVLKNTSFRFAQE